MEFSRPKAKEHIQARVEASIKAEINSIAENTESNPSFVIETLLGYGLKAYNKTKPKKPTVSKAVTKITGEQIGELSTNIANEPFPVFMNDYLLWCESYPNVDVKQELRAIRAWLDANPAKRKTSGGMKRFVNSWLSKAQNNYNPNKPNAAVQSHATLTEIVNDDGFDF